MKLIIAGSRTFSDYQRLCQVLAPDRPHITQVLTGAPGRRPARLPPGLEARHQASALPRRLGALWQVSRHQAPSPDGAGRAPARGVLGWASPQAPPTWCSACASWAKPVVVIRTDTTA